MFLTNRKEFITMHDIKKQNGYIFLTGNNKWVDS